MNYRHAFHAGNFADVLKHVFLARVLAYLARKEAPYRVIDTHAGEGAYDLAGADAERTGEWREGVGRLNVEDWPQDARALLAPYLDAVGPRAADGRPLLYPGSPLLARKMMRPQDRALFCELRPDAYAALKKLSARDKRVKALALDGWTGLNAFLPPPERRGLVLVDPPFEKTDEFQTMAQTAQAAFRKWPQGVYIFWRPIKDLRASAQFVETLAATAPAPTLDLTLSIAPQPPTGLTQTGLTIVNPPFVLAQEAQRLMPLLTAALERAPGAGAFSINEFPQKQKA